MRWAAGPCFTSMVECFRSPGAVIVPRDLLNVHPCNLTLQRQNVQLGGLESTREDWRGQERTERTAKVPENFFPAALSARDRALSAGQAQFSGRSRASPAGWRSLGAPLGGPNASVRDWGGRLRTHLDSYVQIFATSQSYLLLFSLSISSKRPSKTRFLYPNQSCIPNLKPRSREHDCNRRLREAGAWRGCG